MQHHIQPHTVQAKGPVPAVVPVHAGKGPIVVCYLLGGQCSSLYSGCCYWSVVALPGFELGTSHNHLCYAPDHHCSLPDRVALESGINVHADLRPGQAPVLANQIHWLLYVWRQPNLKTRCWLTQRISMDALQVRSGTLWEQSKNQPCKQNNVNSGTPYFACHTKNNIGQELTAIMQ